MPRFPLRTVILMFLTLAAFVWFYWNTHRPPRAVPLPAYQEIQVQPLGGDR